MTENKPLTLRKQLWSDCAAEVERVAPELADIINQLSPGAKLPFYIAEYPYGSKIVHNGFFQLPDKTSGLVTLEDYSGNQAVKKNLGYNFGANPVGLVLKGSIELYIEEDNRIIPYNLIQAGATFGTWRIFDPVASHCPPNFPWEMTAGARSVFMQPKISDTLSHQRLAAEFNIDDTPPRGMLEHWNVFRQISRQSNFSEKWTLRVIFFSKQWFDNIHQNKASALWRQFYYYLYQISWKSSEFWRNQFLWDLTFSRIQEQRQLKIPAYIADWAKHVFTVGVGALPGFAPAINSTALPVRGLQRIYQDLYDIKHHPVILQPQQFQLKGRAKRPVYIPLQFPTALEMAPRNSTRVSAKADLKKINTLIGHYLDAILDNEINVAATSMKAFADYSDIAYFHSMVSKSADGIQPSHIISEQDASFLKAINSHKAKTFAADSSFCRGCIRLS